MITCLFCKKVLTSQDNKDDSFYYYNEKEVRWDFFQRCYCFNNCDFCNSSSNYCDGHGNISAHYINGQLDYYDVYLKDFAVQVSIKKAETIIFIFDHNTRSYIKALSLNFTIPYKPDIEYFKNKINLVLTFQ